MHIGRTNWIEKRWWRDVSCSRRCKNSDCVFVCRVLMRLINSGICRSFGLWRLARDYARLVTRCRGRVIPFMLSSAKAKGEEIFTIRLTSSRVIKICVAPLPPTVLDIDWTNNGWRRRRSEIKCGIFLMSLYVWSRFVQLFAVGKCSCFLGIYSRVLKYTWERGHGPCFAWKRLHLAARRTTRFIYGLLGSIPYRWRFLLLDGLCAIVWMA